MQPAAATDVAAWAAYTALPGTMRAEAQRQLGILLKLQARLDDGMRRGEAIQATAKDAAVSTDTVRRLSAKARGVARGDWLPALAKRYGTSGPAPAECSTEAWSTFCADYARQAQPSFRSCYDRLLRRAAGEGWTVPSLKTLIRRYEVEVGDRADILAREGDKGFKRTLTPQERDSSHLTAGQVYVLDGRRCDVMVRWPDKKVDRPMLIGVQDLYSGKILAWRIARTENADAIRLAVNDAIREFGIPDRIHADNGMGFASKRNTGGTRNRFRFSVKEDELKGVFVMLGIAIHFSLPHHGQSKPIERAWLDVSDRIDKHPALAGAYMGRNPTQKPEKAGAEPVELAAFHRIVSEEIQLHNAKQGRRSRNCGGRSFDETFAASYAAHARPKLAPSQGHMLLPRREMKVDRRYAMLTLHETRYTAEFLFELRGKPVIVRYDPEHLDRPLCVEAEGGQQVLGEARPVGRVSFDSEDAAKATAAERARLKKEARARLKRATGGKTPADVAKALPPIGTAPPLESKVHRLHPPPRRPAPERQPVDNGDLLDKYAIVQTRKREAERTARRAAAG